MEIFWFLGGTFAVLVFLLWRMRRGGSGPDAYVHGAEAEVPFDDEATLRAGSFPGPGGPIQGSGGGNVIGGG
jgi:hypothetical protein